MYENRKMTVSVVVICLCAIIFFSCNKPTNNSTTQFIGTWKGISTCGGNTSLVLIAGSGANNLIDSAHFGGIGCAKTVSVTLIVSGNSFFSPSTTYTDLCGISSTLSIEGAIKEDTLNVIETLSGGVNATCTFTATK
jgi:hypothetical protein